MITAPVQSGYKRENDRFFVLDIAVNRWRFAGEIIHGPRGKYYKSMHREIFRMYNAIGVSLHFIRILNALGIEIVLFALGDRPNLLYYRTTIQELMESPLVFQPSNELGETRYMGMEDLTVVPVNKTIQKD